MKLITACVVALLATAAAAMYDAKDDVVVLTAENFEQEVLKSKDVWLIEFYAPWCGHCKQLTPEWKKAATALKGIAKIGAVDATAHETLGSQFGVQGFPTIKVFANKKAPTEYEGGRTAKDIIDGAVAAVGELAQLRLKGKPAKGKGGASKDGDVVELTDATFESDVLQSSEPWLVEFYAPWCGHCKRLAPEWKKAAAALKGQVKVGAVDATKHGKFNERFGVQGFPTIKWMPRGGKGAAQEYEGGRTAEAIAGFARKNL